MAISEAVDALTGRWVDVVTIREGGDTRYTAVEHAPLLDMLRDSITSNVGERTAGGKSAAERNPMDLNAFTMWADIDIKARTHWRGLSKARPSEDLKDVVRELAGLLNAQRASGGADELTYVRIVQDFETWRRQIWEMFDPPIVKELIGACPHCEERWLYAPDGAKSAALITYYVKSEQPEAKCQRCGEVWVGNRQLLTLGYHLGATVDIESLREMGVDVGDAA